MKRVDTVKVNQVIAGLFVQFISSDMPTCLTDVKKSFKSANGLASLAQELDFAGNQEQSDKVYAMYENAIADVNAQIDRLEDAFVKHNEFLIMALDGVYAHDFRKYFKSQFVKLINS